MELKDFIKTALTDIVNAIDEAQSEVGDKATVMPYGSKNTIHGTQIPTIEPTNIDFDIAVASTSEENATTKGKGGITVTGFAGIGLSKGAEVTNSTENVSRIRFSIQIILPHHEYRKR